MLNAKQNILAHYYDRY